MKRGTEAGGTIIDGTSPETEPTTRRNNADLVVGVGVVAVGLAAMAGTMRFPPASGAVPGPAMFPLLIAILWMPLGVALMITGRRKEVPRETEESAGGRVAGLLGLTVGYAALLPLLGFISCSALFLTVTLRFLGYRHGWRAGAVALGTAFVVYGLFAGVMKVPLPEGWFG